MCFPTDVKLMPDHNFNPANYTTAPLLHICGYCKAEDSDVTKPFRMCGQCRQVRYCCVDHQRAHWSDHKTPCLKWAIMAKAGRST